ncbi:MAG TPA: glycine cleavage system protein GcvH [Tessaracoccus flavescens]|uniref:Glycine cleavage system H protein n=1 Tax=Tessaracoccus flavescens TaxID=399497 RepID=A0A921EMR0_9ACTN|nr:glycine cleavage system protein GcvH [Tessaracoccus flavescens]
MLKYTPEHEWVDTSDSEVAIGITPHATSELGDLVFIELPEIGAEFAKGDEICVIESTKAASGIIAPFDCTVTAVNQEIADSPEMVNEDPEGSWFVRVSPANDDDLDELLDEDAYNQLIGG